MFGRSSVAISFPIAEMLGFHSCHHFFLKKLEACRRMLGILEHFGLIGRFTLGAKRGFLFLDCFGYISFFLDQMPSVCSNISFFVKRNRRRKHARGRRKLSLWFWVHPLLPSAAVFGAEEAWAKLGHPPKKSSPSFCISLCSKCIQMAPFKISGEEGKRRKESDNENCPPPSIILVHDTATFSLPFSLA